MLRKTALMYGALMLTGFMSLPAYADLKLCNKTENSVGVALGYKDREGWATEGWWTVAPQQCVPLMKGNLIARYYYVFAVDRDKGGSWGGKSVMCTRDEVFTIRDIGNCEGRGFKSTNFFEVDTGDAADWTILLSGAKTTPGKQEAE